MKPTSGNSGSSSERLHSLAARCITRYVVCCICIAQRSNIQVVRPPQELLVAALAHSPQPEQLPSTHLVVPAYRHEINKPYTAIQFNCNPIQTRNRISSWVLKHCCLTQCVSSNFRRCYCVMTEAARKRNVCLLTKQVGIVTRNQKQQLP
jgi:hypothetical protein